MTTDELSHPGEWMPTGGLPPGTSVYHYTTSVGLLGMMRSGTIWATEATGLNDTAEVVQGWNYIKEWLGKQPDSVATRYMIELLDDPPMYWNTSDPGRVFVVAASTQGDDANQWRLYGGAGSGYVLELDTAARLQVASTLERRQVASKFRVNGRTVIDLSPLFDVARVSPWTPVVYDELSKHQMMVSLEAWATRVLAWADSVPYDPEDPPPASEVARSNIQFALSTLAQTVKGPGFSGEREVRAFVSFESGDRHVEFHVADFGVVRHLPLTMDNTATFGGVSFRNPETRRGDQWRLPLRSIRLGPALRPELGRAAIQSLLMHEGYDSKTVTVEQSDVRLR